MKTKKLFLLPAFFWVASAMLNAQSVDEIVGKYIDAIGGKDVVRQITTMVSESSLEVMGNIGTSKTTLVNGKAMKMEIDVMGTQVVFCYSDSSGWAINPMSGNYNAVDMGEAEYKAGKEQIWMVGPFPDYAARGFKVELVGQEMVGDVNANKLSVVSPEGVESFYYFDPATNYLIQITQKTEMMGQPMDIVVGMSNYQKTDQGIVIPYKTETNYGGQFFLIASLTKVVFNEPVDPAIFVKP